MKKIMKHEVAIQTIPLSFLIHLMKKIRTTTTNMSNQNQKNARLDCFTSIMMVSLLVKLEEAASSKINRFHRPSPTVIT